MKLKAKIRKPEPALKDDSHEIELLNTISELTTALSNVRRWIKTNERTLPPIKLDGIDAAIAKGEAALK